MCRDKLDYCPLRTDQIVFAGFLFKVMLELSIALNESEFFVFYEYVLHLMNV